MKGTAYVRTCHVRGVRAPGSGVELDRQAGLAGQRSLLLHFLAPSSDEGLIVGFRMLSVPVS